MIKLKSLMSSQKLNILLFINASVLIFLGSLESTCEKNVLKYPTLKIKS